MNPTQQGLVGNGAGVALFGSLLALDPATIEQILGYLAALGLHVSPVQAAAVIGLLGTVWSQISIAKAHNAAPPVASNQLPPNGQRGFARTNFLAFLIVTCMLGMAACASFQQNAPVAQLGVQVATMKVIEADKAHAAERAAKVKEIATDAKSFFDTGTANLSQLEQAVRDRLAPLNLQPSDQLLANALIQAVIAELQQRVGNGAVPADAVYQVSTVLGWVIDATGFYAQ